MVACGTPDSHAMALALWPQALGGLAGRVPLPAVVQEFVNHDATIYKVYVAGNKVVRSVGGCSRSGSCRQCIAALWPTKHASLYNRPGPA